MRGSFASCAPILIATSKSARKWGKLSKKKLKTLKAERDLYLSKLQSIHSWNSESLVNFSPWAAKELRALLTGEREEIGFKCNPTTGHTAT